MIQYSFSPNWYRPQCLSFSHVKNTLFYCSNCIIYKYDLKQKIIQSELNLKDYLFKKQGYSMSSFIKQNAPKAASIVHTQERQKSVDKQKESIEKEKILKISAMELIQGERNLLVVGFNCIGIILMIQITKNGHLLVVRQLIDVSKQTGSSFNGTQFIYVCDQVDNFRENKILCQGNQEIKIVIFSVEGFKVNLSLTLESLNDQFQQPKLKFKLISFQHIQDDKQKTQRSFHIKSISQERNLIKTEQQQMDKKKKLFSFYAVILDNGIQINQKNCNLLIYDQFFQKILIHSSINQLGKLKLIKQDSKSKEGQKQGLKQEISNQAVISADFIQKVNTQSHLKYIVLTKNLSDKSNLFCQKLYLHWFDSSSLVQLFQINEINKTSQGKDNINESQQINPQKEKLNYYKVCIEMIYPKKCHHKLVQQQKSATCIKLIDKNSILLTGKLGEMMILNLKQIQLKLINSPNFVLSIRPYSYEEEKNPFWFIQSSQKHYKDIYAIYRVQRKRNIYMVNQIHQAHQAHKDQFLQKKSQGISRQLYLIGTDHILTSWKVSKTQQDKLDENILSYKSNIKFLTSSVEQIVLSQLQPSLVFLRLKDSNIRSFQPFSDRGYWLNEFWKHTANSFSKQIQKMVMHPVQIGVAVMVSKEGKIVLYDLYEERLIKVIEVKEKVKAKAQSGVKQGKMKHNDREGGKSKDKRSTGNPTNQLGKGTMDLKPLQINSISFEHVSVIQSIQSLFQLQQSSDISVAHQNMAESFEFRCQSFYQRQLDSSSVILIQSNEVILIIEGLQREYKLMRFIFMKKVFKLQRIYKTKYWNKDMLVGTRKRKRELIVGINVNVFRQSKLGVKGLELYKGIEKVVPLTLGNSARYIFKLSSGVYKESQNKCIDEEKNITTREYMLSVVSYKGNKLAISLFRVIVKVPKSTSSINQDKSQAELNVVQIFSSDEIQIPNLSSNNNPVNIEHLVVSQQDNQYLIGVYNNHLEVINVIDYAPMIQGIIDKQEQEKEKFEQSREKEGVRKQSMDKEVILAREWDKEQNDQRQSQVKGQDYRKHQECLEQSNKDDNINSQIQKQKTQKRNFSNLNQQTPKENNKSNNSNQIPYKHSRDLPIKLIQFSDLSYKIESILFNSVSASNTSINQKEEKQFTENCRNNSHLIILGKDQSVRLLELNSYLSHKENKGQLVLSKEQNKQRESKLNSPFKINSKTITVHGQSTSQSTQPQYQ